MAEYNGISGMAERGEPKQLAAALGMPYQNLINLFLRDCAMQKRGPAIQWPAAVPERALPGRLVSRKDG